MSATRASARRRGSGTSHTSRRSAAASVSSAIAPWRFSRPGRASRNEETAGERNTESSVAHEVTTPTCALAKAVVFEHERDEGPKRAVGAPERGMDHGVARIHGKPHGGASFPNKAEYKKFNTL